MKTRCTKTNIDRQFQAQNTKINVANLSNLVEFRSWRMKLAPVLPQQD